MERWRLLYEREQKKQFFSSLQEIYHRIMDILDDPGQWIIEQLSYGTRTILRKCRHVPHDSKKVENGRLKSQQKGV